MAKAVVTPDMNLREIAIQAGGDPLEIMFDPATNELEVPDVDQADLDAVVAGYDSLTPSDDYIKLALDVINTHCGVILARGLEWPVSSEKFLSLSNNAQLKWLLLYVVTFLPAGKQKIIFPITVPTVEDGEVHTVVDAVEVEDIYSALTEAVGTCVLTAAAIKDSVNSAATIADVDAARDAFLAT